jgi:SAM-dependent methyltransferase
MLNGHLRGFVPRSVKGRIKEFIRRSSLATDAVVGSLYTPAPMRHAGEQKLTWSRDPLPPRGGPNDPLSVPPQDLTMGYVGSGDAFLRSGVRTSTWLRKIIEREQVSLTHGAVAAEWGCASGRVLRHFEPEARHCEFWGLDQDGAHLNWSRQHLSPPFKFVTCTAYPHLPFEDNSLDFVYGISVFTHLTHLIDLWLMEFRRVLKRGRGVAVFTIHDEHSLAWFEENPDEVPDWLEGEDLSKGLTDDVTIYGGQDWGHTFICFRSDWVRQDWSRYLDVISIEPRAEQYHTAVVLRKA